MEGVLPSHRFSWDTFPLPLIENKRKAWYLGKAGSERALKNFSSKIFIDKMSRIYRELEGKKN
jgi:hypothetical protein